MTAVVSTPTAACLTPAGRGAVAVIRVRMSASNDLQMDTLPFAAANGRSLTRQTLRRMIFGRWGRGAMEDVVLCRTADDVIEIQCHGGDAAVDRVLADLAELGISSVPANEQLRMTSDALEAELRAVQSRALTWRTADLINEQCRGLLRQTYEALGRMEWNESERSAALKQIDELLGWADFGRHLSEPWSVVLTGRPNVGKSSLINALLGYQRAIVSATPGTTRDVVTSTTAFDGWPVHLSDTAGLRDAVDALEASGIERARQRVAAADCRLVLIDIGEPPTLDDQRLLTTWPEALIIAHKCDRPVLWETSLPRNVLRVSSLSGEGLVELQEQLARRLVPEVPAPGIAVPLTARHCRLLEQARVQLETGSESAFRSAAAALIGG